MKKIILVLMLLIATFATISAQDEPIEQTAMPYMNLYTMPDGSYEISIFNSDDDPDALIYYMIYSFDNDIITDWREYDAPFIINALGSYHVEAYAIVPGKTESNHACCDFTVLPLEQTAAPSISLTQEPNTCYGIVTIENTDYDLDASIYYRVTIDYGEQGEWMLYSEPLLFNEPGSHYFIEAYAKAAGKTASNIVATEFVLPQEMTFDDPYDFELGGIYYKELSDSTLCVTYKSDQWVAYPYANGKESYSGYVEIPETVVYRGNVYTVTQIGDLAFWECNITGISLPQTLTTIEEEAFMACSLDSVYIPASVTSIEPAAFAGCNQLQFIQVDENNPVYDSRESCNAIIETATNTMVCATRNTVIPTSVTAIGEQCFGHFPQGLTMESIVIPDQVVSIGEQAFMFCTSLTDVKFGNSVATIGERAFNLTAIENLVLPASVNSIAEQAFSYCTNLKSVTCKAIVPPVAASVFDNTDFYEDEDPVYNVATLFVPNESLEAYRAHEEWGRFMHIVPFIGAGPGDINGDGSIGISDVTAIIDQLLSGDLPAYADVNGDGVVSILDVTTLIDMLLTGNY